MVEEVCKRKIRPEGLVSFCSGGSEKSEVVRVMILVGAVGHQDLQANPSRHRSVQK